MSARVVVAMSGGVDSSVAAALMVAQGHDAIGITMHLAGDASRCCSLDDAEDARRVARTLGMPFYVAPYQDRFRSEVMEPFADAYLSGRTPIPCVACNRRFKFHYLLERARALGAERIATGHYARIDADPETGAWRLRAAVDTVKDQSYFLFDLDQQQLARTALPLGALRKDEVRMRARALGLATAEKPESQEICFVPGGDYARVVEQIRPDAATAGEIVDEDGRVLGRHAGIHHFTVGQRRGLRLAAGERLYVTRIEPEGGRVVVGPEATLLVRTARLENVSWIAGETPEEPIRACVRVRYRHEGAEATIEPDGKDGARLRFSEPVRAIAPGQAAVFYDEDVVLGGGWICREPA